MDNSNLISLLDLFIQKTQEQGSKYDKLIDYGRGTRTGLLHIGSKNISPETKQALYNGLKSRIQSAKIRDIACIMRNREIYLVKTTLLTGGVHG